MSTVNIKLIESTPNTDSNFLAVYAKNDCNKIIGGAITYTIGTEMLLDTLWVTAAYRQQGIGRRLIHRIESIAQKKRIRLIHLDVYNTQVKGFYTKLGYSVDGWVKNPAAKKSKLFLKKELPR